ncbi:MAG TPA: hypothetical protein PLI18_01730 [Pirellulaceae bacterium]|nr:hypothetical protein [Pirellulaceae bacterium]
MSVRQRCGLGRLLMIGVLVALASRGASAAADEPLLPARCHVWGRFEIGAWSRVTVDVETYERGERLLRSGREELRELVQRDEQGYALKIVSIQELPWRRDAEPAGDGVTRSYPWFVGRERLIGPPEGVGVDFEGFGEPLPCRSYEYQVESEGRITTFVDVVHPDRFPFVLQRVGAVPSGAPDLRPEYRVRMSISHGDVAIDLGDRLVSGVETRTVVERPGRTTEIVELLAAEVPGGLVSKRSTERDESGVVVRREVIELVDFSETPGEPGIGRGEVRGREGRLFRRRPRSSDDRSDD